MSHDAIHAALAGIEQEMGVHVIFAAESGSRAWGFESTDSDYDVRFVYVRPIAAMLKVRPHRDTIERMLPGDLDLSGWDVRKTLALTLNGNQTVREWLVSPIVYRAEAPFTADLMDLAAQSFDPRAAGWHYVSLLGTVQAKYLRGDEVPLKKYLYAVRPALVLEWMRRRPGVMPPMDVDTLRAGAGLDASETAALDTLIAAKRRGDELGKGARWPVLDRFIERAGDGAKKWLTSRNLGRVESIEDLDAADPNLRAADDLLFSAVHAADRFVRLANDRPS